MTYYDEVAEQMCNGGSANIQEAQYNKNKANLTVLSNTNSQLLMFLSDGGGSGKSEVLTRVLQYCSEFCRALNIEFTADTLRIIALSGVAATLINGDTIDLAAGLQKNKAEFDSQQYDSWSKTRLFIIEEIFFMACNTLVKLDRHFTIRNLKVRLVYASQVKHLVVQTKGKNTKTHTITPTEMSFNVKYPLPIQLQFNLQ